LGSVTPATAEIVVCVGTTLIPVSDGNYGSLTNDKEQSQEVKAVKPAEETS
jgi:hypothetical protein